MMQGSAFLARAYLSTGSEMLLLLFLTFQILGGSQSQLPGYKLEVAASVTVQEGLCIQVPCAFSFPSYQVTRDFQAFGSWFKEGANTKKDKPVATNDPNLDVQKEARGRFHLVGDPKKDNCSLSIVNVQKRDSGEYFFRIVRGQALKFNYLRYMVNVSVKALTQKPEIYIPRTLEPGHLVKVICVVPSDFVCGTPPIFSWTGAMLSSQEVSRETTYFSELTLTPSLQDHGSNLTCQVTLPGAQVSTERTVHLSVTYRNGLLTFSKGIFLGAGIMALFALCLILALVKFLRKRKVENSDLQDSKEVDNIHQVYEGVPLDQHRGPSLPLTSLASQAPSEEIHYASLNFKRINP
ncbi:myeloid cell surface antigen CD33-like [Phascolarctos cinereus]|uniref:Myeloid cell surface antigen CD33-like n=1 Tax=Phascolarctos cinereus TaxID=38626 RepID=A0A6P5LNG5_PHACI|nr:myeloid cell surface antigen CD33-like [Phascolarctos cinereus]